MTGTAKRFAVIMRELIDDGADEVTVANMAMEALIAVITDPARCGHVGIKLASGAAMRCVLDAGHEGNHNWRRGGR